MPETALRPQKRAEGLSGGAAKNSYVKCGGVAGSYFTHHVVTQTESREKKPSGRSRVVFYWFFAAPGVIVVVLRIVICIYLVVLC